MKNENRSYSSINFFDKGFPWVILLLLLGYSYLYLVDIPYVGFSIGGQKVLDIYEEKYYDPLFEEGAELIRVNGVDMEQYVKDFSLSLFDTPESQEHISIEYMPLSGGPSKFIDSPIPGFTLEQLLRRIASQFGYG